MEQENRSYIEAGFNPFFRRSIISGNSSRALGSNGAQGPIDLSTTEIRGTLGGVIQVGDVTLNGPDGDITLVDREGNVIFLATGV